MELNCGQEEKRSGLECGQAAVEGEEACFIEASGGIQRAG
jgi:hypothetical protein